MGGPPRPPAARSLQEVATYRKQGFLAITDFASAEEMTNMRARAEKIVDEFEYDRASVFSTTDQKRTTDDYFLDSANGISCFFEEKAHDERGNLCVPKALAINKIGHSVTRLRRRLSRVQSLGKGCKPHEEPRNCPTRRRCRACTSSNNRASAAKSSAYQD